MLISDLESYSRNNFPKYIDKNQEYNEGASVFFGHLVQNFSQDDLFEDIYTKISQSFVYENQQAITIAGNPSVGKTLLLTDLYVFLLKNKDKYLPIYINLHNIEDELNDEIVKNKDTDLKDQFWKEWHKFVEYINKSPHSIILIIDGVDEYERTPEKLDEQFLREVSNITRPVVPVIGLGVKKLERENNTRLRVPIKSKQELFRYHLTEKSVYQHDFELFIDHFINWSYIHRPQVFRNQKNTTKPAKSYIIKKLEQYSFRRINCFTLWLLLEKQGSYESLETLSEYYQTFIEEELRNESGATKISLRELSNQVYKVIINGERSNDVKINGYRFVRKHHSIRDYLIAFHIVNRLFENQSFVGQSQELNHLYDYGINRFCKEIISGYTPNEQLNLFEKIESGFEELNWTAKTHFGYIIGRFKQPVIKNKCKRFLREQLSSIPKTIDNVEPEIILLYRRTVFISLIFLGDENAPREYITELIKDCENDRLNRGFHLEYYGDIPYDPTSPETLAHQDELGPCNSTFEKLYDKCTQALQGKLHPLFFVEIYTLGSLIQHRHSDPEGILHEDALTKIKTLIGSALENHQVRGVSILVKYLKMLQINFQFSRFNPMSIQEVIYRIKDEPRVGWTNRNLGNMESVAGHSWGAVYLANTILSERINEPKEDLDQYNKGLIQDMLLAHDIAEAATGDYQSNEVPNWVKEKQRDFMEYIGMLSTYPILKEFINLRDNWKRFNNNSEDDINARFANEIDKLENMIQLHHIKYHHKKDVEDFDKFKKDLDSKIQIPRIRNYLENLFEAYKKPINTQKIIEQFRLPE